MKLLQHSWPGPPTMTGVGPNWSAGLTEGLMCLVAANEGSGPTVYDSAGGLALTMAGGAAWGHGGVVCAASNARAQVAWPYALTTVNPITAMCGVTVLGAQSTQALIWGLWGGGMGIFFGNTSNQAWGMFTNGNTTGTAQLAIGQSYILAAIFAPGSQSLYTNGIPSGGSTLATHGNGAANLAIGDATNFTNRNPNVAVTWGAIWYRALAQPEVMAITAQPGRLWAPRQVPAPTASPTPTPTPTPTRPPTRGKGGAYKWAPCLSRHHR